MHVYYNWTMYQLVHQILQDVLWTNLAKEEESDPKHKQSVHTSFG